MGDIFLCITLTSTALSFPKSWVKHNFVLLLNSIHDQTQHSKFSFSTSMAALSVNHSFYYKRSCSVQELRSRSRNCPRIHVVISCQNNEPLEKSTSATTKKEQKEENSRQLFSQVLGGVQKFGRGLKENMSPQRKGDWKDLMLMSLSFAVYVYMSQKIVCAYFAWMSMPKHSW